MTRIRPFFIVLMLASSTFAQADRQELELRLKETEKERDDLRRELALAKLKIATLQEKLAAADKSDKPDKPDKPDKSDASTGTAASGAATKDADDEVDEAGIAKSSKLWDVKVISSKVMDAAEVDTEINAQRSALRTTQSQAVEAKKRVDKMRTDNDYWYQWYRNDNSRKKPFSDNVISAAKADIARFEAKERAVNSRILSLEREKADAKNTLIVMAESKEGTLLRLMAKGPIRTAAESMAVGRKYIVEGRKGGADVVIVTKVIAVAE